MKLVSTYQRATWLALFLTLTVGMTVPSLAQNKDKKAGSTPARQNSQRQPEVVPFLKTPLLGQGRPNTVPTRRNAMVGDGTFIPPDVPVRSLKGVTGFERDKAGSSRVRIGGTNGASVIEKVVNVNRSEVLDERTPFWSSDEQFLYFTGNTINNTTRYVLMRTTAGDPAETSNASARALTDPTNTQYDYYFPAVSPSNARVAFLRSEDGKGIDDQTKRWNLYVSNFPVSDTAYIDTAPLGPTNLRSITAGRDFPDGAGGRVAFTNVGRPSWVGSNDIVFAAQLAGSPNYHIFSVNVQTGIIFQLTAGPADERNPAVSPDARTIAFDSNSQAIASSDTGQQSYVDGNPRSEAVPAANPTRGQNPGTVRNVFTMTLNGRETKQFTGRYANAPAVNSVEPAWSSTQPNGFTNPQRNNLYIAFSSNRIPTFAPNDTRQATITGWAVGPNNTSSIYYVLASRNRTTNTLNILTESAATDLDNDASDGARRLDTANDTLVNGNLNDVTKPRFADRYPSWSPIIRAFRLGFQSNRNGTYNVNGFGSGFVPTPTNVNNSFIASLIDITAPSLIRYDTSNPTGEVVHINLVTDQNRPYNPSLAASVRSRDNGITPDAWLHFAVRVEDREAGLRPENNPDGAAVYIQFKNPNSKYQATQQGGDAIEHKEFQPIGFMLVENNSATAFANTAANGFTMGPEYECQAISAGRHINTNDQDLRGRNTLYYSHLLSHNNQFGGRLYDAGGSDRQAFSGVGNPPLDDSHPTTKVWLKLEPLVELNEDGTPRLDSNGNKIPLRPADNAGGVLYGAKMQAPSEASDWYMDVIVYDNSVNPFDSTQRYNWIIYDNVWGFSTAAPISGEPTDVLVVMDYPLGQKFFASRFDLEAVENLQPLMFGAESYFTDVQLSLFPSEIPGSDAPVAPGGTTPREWASANRLNGGPDVHPFSATPGSGIGNFDLQAFRHVGRSGIPNVLGVESYNDSNLNEGAVDVVESANGVTYRLPPTGRYSIWRILSRGAVPSSLLTDYLPQVTSAPPDTTKGETQNRTIQHATRFVVWASPFSGNLFVGPGTITDTQAQANLEAFVMAGGRLFISGQDIGWALVGSGQSSHFFSNVLKARYLQDDAGTVSGLNAADTTIANTYIGHLRQDAWSSGIHNYAGNYNPQNGTYTYFPLNATSQNHDLPYTNSVPTPAQNLGDASYTARGWVSFLDVIQANPDTTPAGLPANTPPNSTDEFLYSTTPAQPPALAAPGVAPTVGTHFSAIIATSFPLGTSVIGDQPAYNPNVAFVPQGKIIYCAAGFESIGMGWYTFTAGQLTYIASYGRRAELMHNISDTLRTGTLVGQVIDDSGAPVGGALVRAIRNGANDAAVAAGTAITDSNGNYTILGLQPGLYFAFGSRPGFFTQHSQGTWIHGGWRNSVNVQLKRASPGSLTGIRNTTTNTYGGVFGPDGITPVTGIEIQVRRLEPDGRWTLVSTISHDGINPITLPDGTTITLPAGAYSFPSLAVANYVVIANARTTVVDGVIVNKVRGQDGKLPGVNEAYSEVRVSTPPQAEVRLGNGTVVVNDPAIGPALQITEAFNSQVDFLLPAVPQKVNGQVVDQDTNQGLPGGFVTATLKSTGAVIANGTTDGNGNYSLTRINTPTGEDPTQIPAGTYIITATVNGYSSDVPPSEVNKIEVTIGGSLEPVKILPQLRLKKLPPGSVSGLVRRYNGLIHTTTGVEGAVITLYAVNVVNGVQVQAEEPSYTIPVNATPTTEGDYTFNFRQADISPGTYNAYVSKPGLTGNPSPFANITVTTGQETRGINFTLEPVKIYGEGIQLISVPQDFSAVPTRQIFGLTANGDNNGDGTTNQIDQQIYNTFNVADWTGTEYQISPDLPLRLGKGYFARFGSVSSVVAVGTPATTATFNIDLSNGWNLIGHPFSNQQNISDPAADIDISSADLVTYSYTAPGGQQRQNVSLQQAIADNALQSKIYSYTGSNSGGAYIQGSLMKQWFGYWFRAFVPVQMTVKYPGGTSRAFKASKTSGGKFRSVTTAEREAPVIRSIGSKALNDWRIQIGAQQGNLRDTDNSVGVSPDASEGFDNKYDIEKPPLVREVAGLYVGIQGTSIAGRSASFSDNVKAANGQTKSWEFTVESTDGSNEIMVYWPNISRLPRGIEPMLVDVTTGRRVAMRSSSAFRFTPGGRAQRKFRIEVAPPSSLPLDILNLRATPTRSMSGATYRFNFMTTRSVDVNAEVKTLTGRTLKRFKTRAAGGSETSLVWDGRDEGGSQLPPGPYLLSISAQDEQGRKVTRNVPFQSIQ